MQQYGNILIKNIYYMLCYVFRGLSNIGSANLDKEEFENLQDLFARILYLGISTQIKRGLYKEYIEEKEELSCLKGKINISEFISTMSLVRKKLVCEFDEYSENTLFNQILKSACLLLIRKGNLQTKNKKDLKSLLLYFSNVDEIELRYVKWSQFSFHRNNTTYKMLLNLCYLLVNSMLQTTEDGTLKLNNYLDDQHMHKIYEKFILEFYRKHYPELNANSSYIQWDIEDSNGIEFLPSIHSDIMLTKDDKCLIIDAKFYSHTMNEQYNKKSYISSNLYQIYTYVSNKKADKNYNQVAGMLLYAKTHNENTPDNEYMISGNQIAINTLDLNTEWLEIENKLNKIAEKFYCK